MRIIRVSLLAAGVLLALAAPAVAGDKVLQLPHRYVTIREDCRIFVHHDLKNRATPELHVQCTVKQGSVEGATIRYRYPEAGVPSSFGALIEDNGHGRYGDVPFITARLSRHNPRIGIVRIPGPHLEAPNGTYVHVMMAVWNGPEGAREVNWYPYG
jgi:hypothetical protein